MKNRIVKLALISALTVSMAAVAAGCGNSTAPADSSAGTETASESETASEATSEGASEVSEEAPEKEEIVIVAEINYANIGFDFAEDIAAEKETVATVPASAEIDVELSDTMGITGMVIVPALDAADTENYYLNAYAAGDELTLAAKDGAVIKSAVSSISGEIALADGAAAFVPAALDAADPVDEIITVTMESGEVYNIHTLPQAIPDMTITGEGVAEADTGVYSFAVDKFMLRVNTDGELLYYRNINCVGEQQVENFATQIAGGKTYYTVFVELRKEYRNIQGGYSSGMYLVMDENYNEIDQVTLAENADPNHTHGEGYLDQHEFVILEDGHYILLSYTPLLVNNLPDTVEGLDGGSSAYVWAGIIQEVKDGTVISEINTADYPLLYESAVEKINYANSTDQGVTVNLNGNDVPSPADGWQDYVHVNSVDYTMDEDGTIDKILVSMRDQSAVYQFDIDTGAMEWILGGKASTLTGYEDYTSTRTDDNGVEFQALTFGQHFARYTNKNEAGMIEGNTEISVFDNQTGIAPFITAVEIPTLTRTFKATIDTAANTAVISDVINGTDLNQKTDKYHIASHCGSVQYNSATSVTIGWGLHGVIDNIGPMAPEGTIGDKGYADLRQGSRPVFTDYDPSADTVTFELSLTRSPLEENSEGLFSYRTYKTAE